MRDSLISISFLAIWFRVKGWTSFLRDGWFSEVKARRGIEIEPNKLREIEERCLEDFQRN